MKSSLSVFFGSFTLIRRDPMLILLLVAPFLVGAALCFGLPLLAPVLLDAFGFDLVPWYALADLLILMLTPMMAGMLCGFLMLDERDEGVGIYYGVTPIGSGGYLFSRLILPLLWSVLIAPLLMFLFSLSHPNWLLVFAIALAGGLFGAVYTLSLLALAGNKVEGLAVAKILGLTVMPMIVPFITDSPFGMLAGIFPSYWVGALINGSFLSFSAAIVISAVWLLILCRRIRTKL